MADPVNAGGAVDAEYQQMGLDQAQYEALERDFQEVLNELTNDPQMQRFRSEYERIHRAMRTSYESEKRLARRCKELNDTILQNAARVKGAIKLTQEDSNTISVLRKEVEKCWKLVEQAREKEDKARSIIAGLREEIANLYRIVEDGSGLALGQDSQLTRLIKSEEDLLAEVEKKQQIIDSLELTKTDLRGKIVSLENDLVKERESLQAKQHENDVLKEDAGKQKRQEKFFLEKENKLTNEKKKIMDEWTSVSAKLAAAENENISLCVKLEEAQSKFNQKKVDHDFVQMKLNREQNEHLASRKDNEDKKEELDKLLEQYEQMKREKSDLYKLNQKLTTNNNKLQHDRDTFSTQKKNAESQMQITKGGVNALTREIEYLRKQADHEKTDILNLIRDRDMMGKYIKKAEEINEKNRQEIMRLNGKVETLNQQGRAKADNIQQLLNEIYKLEKERDKAAQDFQRSNNNLLQLVEDLRLRSNMISELKKETVENEAKLKQQQSLYEAVRAERNLYSKSLIEQTDEVADLKKRFLIAEHQISQLKAENQARQQTLATQISLYAMSKKQIEKRENEKLHWKNKHDTQAEQRKQLGQQILKLEYVINQMAEEIDRSKKEQVKTINERDILGTQLIRRNDELALLYEKIKILQNTLAKGELQYQQRLEDIRLLKFKIGDHKSELKIVRSEAQQIPDLRKEIYNLQQLLLAERLQVKALSEELENPLNCHRWRRLAGTDPDTWEMLQKIHTLQKRLIKKTEEVVERDALIQEKENLYVELKNLLARQPGPQVAEQLSIYQQNLKEKTSQMKAMAAELNMYQAQVNEYKYEIERLTRELQDMKRKYYEQKRREQMQREAQARLEPKVINQVNAPVQKFAGGGFNLAV